MFKPCPNCGFLVALIAGREASQRCPRCGSALVTEGEMLDADPRFEDADEAAAPPRIVQSADVSTADHAAARPAYKTAPRQVCAQLAEAPAQHAKPAPPAPADGPSFTRHARPRGGRAHWRGWLAVTALALLLALQLLLAQRDALARDAAWRPLVLRACGVLRCSVPAWHEPGAYAMLARGVRPNPARPGVLHATATVRNDARWPQAAPVVVLSLADVDGRVVGARAIAPDDYGRSGEVAPGDSIDIAFDVREPAAHVESFDFQLQ